MTSALTRAFLTGAAAGVAIAAPVGPIGVLCIRRTLVEGWAMGLICGLGAATADAAFGAAAGLGLSAVSGFLTHRRDWLGILGGAFLCYLGVRAWSARVPGSPEAASGRLPRRGMGATRWAAYFSTFFLTLTNPMTILSFAAFFAGFGAQAAAGRSTGLLLVAGVFIGSAGWWMVLCAGTGLLRRRIATAGLRRINQVSSLILWVFGIYSIGSRILALSR